MAVCRIIKRARSARGKRGLPVLAASLLWSAESVAFLLTGWFGFVCFVLCSTLRLQGWSVAAFPPDSPNQLQHGQSAESHQPPNQSELATLPI